MPLPPYLVLLHAGFCLPPALPPARCALTAPFHPYPSTRHFVARSGQAPQRGLPRASREAASREAVCFLCHFPSGCPARALPGALPYGVRTFLPPLRCARRRAIVCLTATFPLSNPKA